MKKKLLKYFLCLMLALTCMFALFACGDKKDPNGGEPVVPVSISLSREEIAVGIMEEYLLEATVTGTDEEVIWITENAAIATVENGLVVGVTEGNTVITASVGEHFATCSVLVLPSADVPVINVNGDEKVELLVGDEWQLSPTVSYCGEEYMDGTFSYQSNNIHIATVDTTGRIVAVDVGVAKISVNASWRSYTDSVYLKTEITVEVKENWVLKILNNPVNLYSYEIKGYGKDYQTSVQLEYEAYEGDTNIADEVTFISSDDTVATVDTNGVINAVGVGEAEIFISYTKNGLTYQSNRLKVKAAFPVFDLTYKSVPLVINGALESVEEPQIKALFDFNKEIDGGKTVSKITDENGQEIEYNPTNEVIAMPEAYYGYHEWLVENVDYAVQINVYIAERIINTAEELANLQTLLGNFKAYDAEGNESATLPLWNNKTDQANAGWYSYGGYYALGRDIDMTGVDPVVKSTHMGSFPRDCAGLYGVFEGAGHKITGLSTGVGGLFGEVSKDGVIRNLVIEDAKIKGTAYYSGIIARNFSGTLENVTITANLSNNFNGGTIGYFMYGGSLKNVSITATGLRTDNNTGALVFWSRGVVVVENVNVYRNTDRPIIVSDEAKIRDLCDGSDKDENDYDITKNDFSWT